LTLPNYIHLSQSFALGDSHLQLIFNIMEVDMISQQIDIEQLGKITAYNESNNPVTLAELWKEHVAVLVFVRHFG
jgi:hypothetical protein